MKINLFLTTIVIAIVVLTNGSLECFAQKGEWVRNDYEFPKDVPIFAVALKDNGGKSEVFNEVWLSDKTGGHNNVIINAKKLTIKINNKKFEFNELKESEDGWRVYEFEKPHYFLSNFNRKNCLTNVRFFAYDERIRFGQLNRLGQLKINTNGSQNVEAQKKEEPKEPMIMIVSDPLADIKDEEFTTPEKAGYLLVNTKTMSGFKCEYFAERVVRVHFGNGDFAVFSDEKVFSNGPNDQNPGHNANSIGDWQIHAEDGGVVRQENGIITITNPNGSIVKSISKRDLRWDVDWKKPIVYRDWFPRNLVTTPGSSTPLKNVTFKNNSNYSELNTRDGFRAMEVTGNMMGNRVYASNEEGELFAFIQIVDGLPIPAIESDSVIGIKTEVCENRWHNNAIQLTINYVNGDSIVCTGESDAFVVNSGTIHRNGGVLTIKVVNDKTVQILTFSNGDKYVGDFNYRLMYPTDKMHLNMVSDRLCLYQLAWPELQYWNGTLIKADGKRIEFKKGKTDQQIAAEKKAAEAKATAQYNDLCKKFGKKYVDAALNQLPIVGMPEELLNAAFTLKFIRQSGDYKLYRITGLGWKNFGRTLTDNATLYSIWVRNGRVVDVRYWGN